jgi:glycerate kinase
MRWAFERTEPTLRIVVAPNALKGSLSASEAAEAIGQGAHRALGSEGALQVVLAPVSDGGDGLVGVLVRVLDAERRRSRVAGPLGSPVEAEWLLSRDGATAVVEMAAASGIALLAPDELDPMRASTRGTGELVREAVRAGARRVLVGSGGSATVDGGTGAARALGVRFLDEAGGELGPSGAALARVRGIDASGPCSMRRIRCWGPRGPRASTPRRRARPTRTSSSSRRACGTSPWSSSATSGWT